MSRQRTRSQVVVFVIVFYAVMGTIAMAGAMLLEYLG